MAPLCLGVGCRGRGDSHFKALQMAPASHVAPIDKLSLPLTITLAAAVLGEPLSPKLILGVALMVVGAILTLG
jgi:transporter family protein